MEIILALLAVLVVLEFIAIIILFFLLIKNNKAYHVIEQKGQQIVKGKLNVEDI